MDRPTEVINSLSNPKIKWLRSLHKSSCRREQGLFLVEGHTEIERALKHNFKLHSQFVCPELDNDHRTSSAKTHLVARSCFQKIAYRGNSDGRVAVFEVKNQSLEDLSLSSEPLLLVVEAVEKPGNLGAIIRTADGAGADAVIVCDPKTDLFNPNVIRASLGTIFSKPLVACTNPQLLAFLQYHKITAYAAAVSDTSQNYARVNLASASALVLGTEHDGLSNFWLQQATPISIPMHGENDSLNVSVAAGVLAYEANRQRHQAS